jgi:hypothetical protein
MAEAEYVRLVRNFDVSSPIHEDEFGSLLACLESVERVSDADSFSKALVPDDSSFDAVRQELRHRLDECRRALPFCQEDHRSRHVILYPFHDAVTASQRMIDLGRPSDGKAFAKNVNVCLSVLAFILLVSPLVFMFKSVFLERNFTIDFLEKKNIDAHRAAANGLDDPEQSGEHRWRWSLGRVVSIDVPLENKNDMILHMQVNNEILNQGLTVLINERMVFNASNVGQYAWDDPGLKIALPFKSIAGENRIRIHFAQWNGKDGVKFSSDPRQLGVKFYSLRLDRNDFWSRLRRWLSL